MFVRNFCGRNEAHGFGDGRQQKSKQAVNHIVLSPWPIENARNELRNVDDANQHHHVVNYRKKHFHDLTTLSFKTGRSMHETLLHAGGRNEHDVGAAPPRPSNGARLGRDTAAPAVVTNSASVVQEWPGFQGLKYPA
jgi:hypothetical protein